MGKTLMGGTERGENVGLLTPQQQKFLSLIGSPGVAGGAQQAYQQFLQPVTPESYQDVFQQSVVDPAMMNFEQSVLPAIQQSFGDVNAGSSSALNQALGQSAQDLTTALGQQYGQFYQQGQANQLNALQQLQGLAGQRTFEPQFTQTQGILGPLIGMAGQIGAGAMGSPYGFGGGATRGY